MTCTHDSTTRCNTRLRLVEWVLVIGSTACSASLPYDANANWTSKSLGCTTGLALADLNRDEFADLVVAVGNDTGKGPVAVYENDRHGRFTVTPTYESNELQHHTNLAVGDVNGDGFLDLAVSVGLGANDQVDVGWVDVYRNNGGRLETNPSFRTSDRFASFACALADVDGDGDLDLVATVMSVLSVQASVRVFRNDGGRISPTATWTSDDSNTAFGLVLADVDDDGMLDLVTGAEKARLYRAMMIADHQIVLPKKATFTTPDGSTGAFFLDAGVWGTKRHRGLMVSYNDLCYLDESDCQQSRFEAYDQRAQSTWRSDAGSLGGGVVLADVDGDDFTDVVAGSWGVSEPTGAAVRIFRGQGDGFEGSPAYTSKTISVAESLAIADLDRSYIEVAHEVFNIKSERAVVSLERQLIERIDRVKRNGRLVPYRDYASVPGRSWVSFRERLRSGDVVAIDYTFSRALDLAVASCGSGNLIYYHQ